jgi:hypothetical protein
MQMGPMKFKNWLAQKPRCQLRIVSVGPTGATHNRCAVPSYGGSHALACGDTDTADVHRFLAYSLAGAGFQGARTAAQEGVALLNVGFELQL